MQLRSANIKDIDCIVKTVVDNISTFPMCDGDYVDPIYLADVLKAVIPRDDCLLLIDVEDNYCNTILFVQCCAGWYNPTMTCNELLLWTHPSARS